MSRLWAWLAAIGAGMLLVIQRLAHHRATSQRDAQDAHREREQAQAAADKSAEVSHAQQEARKNAETARLERESRPAGQRPSGQFGRLHDD